MIKNKKELYEMLSCKALRKTLCYLICFAVPGAILAERVRKMKKHCADTYVLPWQLDSDRNLT